MLGLILGVIALAFLAGAAYFYYKNYFRPRRIIRWYESTFESLGYKVITLPYHPSRITLADIRKYSQKEHGDACYEEKHTWPHHDIVITNTGNIVTLIFLKPRLIKSLFSPEKQHALSKSMLNKAGFNMTLRNSLILNEGDYWKRKRKIFTDILNFDFIKSKVPKMIQIAQKKVEKMERQCKNIHVDPQNRSFEVQLLPYFEEMIAEIVVGVFFGTEDIEMNIDGTPINRFITHILADSRKQTNDWTVLLLGEKAYQWGLTSQYRDLANRIKKLRTEVRKLLDFQVQVTTKRQLKSYSNLFEALIFLKQQRKQENDLLDTEEFISEFCAFMSASNDSTANFINGFFVYLTHNPEVLSKLQIVIRNIVKRPQDITFANIKSIDYLEWCQNETIRMYGPATSILLREAAIDMHVDNLPIFRGTGIKIEMLASHYNPSFYKEPFKFDPLRWQSSDPDPFKLGGFGFGPHSCLGKSLALLTSKIIATVILFRYQKLVPTTSKQVRFVFEGMYKPESFTTSLIRSRKQEQAEERKKQVQAKKEISNLYQ